MANYILFTTRDLEKPDNLFISDYKIEISDKSYLSKFHKKFFKNKIGLIKDEINKLEGNELKKFLEKVLSLLSKIDNIEENFSEIRDLISDQNKEITQDDKEDIISYIEDSIPKMEDLPIDISEIITEQKGNNLFTRRNLYYRKRKKEEEPYVFGYRCLDIDYDYVNSEEDFITSIILDIANITTNNENKYVVGSGKTLDNFFNNNTITLILHEADIKFPKVGDRYLTPQKIKDYLLTLNPALKPYCGSVNKDYKDTKIKVYVFQHTINSFLAKLVSSYKDILGSDIDSFSTEITDAIKEYFKYRKEYKEIENNIFKNGWSKSERKKFIELKKKVKRKLY